MRPDPHDPLDIDFTEDLDAAALELALTAPEAAPPPRLRGRLLDRIAAPVTSGIEVHHAESAQWLPMTQGVTYRPLYQDPATGLMTLMVRMEPGSRYPRHLHTRAEQCLVMEGDLRQPGCEMRAGDFVLAHAGTVHPPTWSETGNLLLIVADPANEIVTGD